MVENDVLVSVCVLTYNSSAYVLETLESVYRQTYRNIELIISDDASSDDTVEKCRRWVDEGRQPRFRNVVVSAAGRNTGVPANANRSVRAARGEWIKLIAGDDALLPGCIADYVNFIARYPGARICHSVIRKYADSLDEAHFLNDAYPRKKMTDSLSTASRQHRFLQMGCWVLTPSVFMSKALIEEAGYYDETIPLCEDWPMWLKITEKGNRIYFMDKATVQYRIHTSSISHRQSAQLIPDRQYQVLSRVYAGYLAGRLPFFLDMEKRYNLALYVWLEKHGRNDRGRTGCVLLFRLLAFPLAAVTWLRYVYLTGWSTVFSESRRVIGRRIKKRMSNKKYSGLFRNKNR